MEQAKADFRTIGNARNIDLIVEQAQNKSGVSMGREGLDEKLKVGAPGVSVTPKTHTITDGAGQTMVHVHQDQVRPQLASGEISARGIAFLAHDAVAHLRKAAFQVARDKAFIFNDVDP